MWPFWTPRGGFDRRVAVEAEVAAAGGGGGHKAERRHSEAQRDVLNKVKSGTAWISAVKSGSERSRVAQRG